MTTETETKCCECEETVDLDGDHGWSAVKEDYLCWGCYESDTNYCSTVNIVSIEGVVKKYYIGDHVRMTEYGDDLYREGVVINREYIHSGGYRGHYETTIEGWTDILNGWTTGGWGDEVAQRKQRFNEWADQILKGELLPPAPVAIAVDPTSNVFSTAITVLTPEPEKVRAWLTEDYEGLYEALS